VIDKFEDPRSGPKILMASIINACAEGISLTTSRVIFFGF
jgi:hypothetical protein